MKTTKTIKNKQNQTKEGVMLAEERRQHIINSLNECGIVRVSDLSAALNTTEATIRRDLDNLQAEGIAIRFHGGAKSCVSSSEKMTIQENSVKMISEKRYIAALAYRYISEKDCIALDTSTTVLELAKLLREKPIKGLTIITSSFPVFDELRLEDSYTLIFVGGKYNRMLDGVSGILTQIVMDSIHVDKAFIGVAGIDPNYGFSGPYEDETVFKRSLVAVSNQQYMLVDHTKFFCTYIYKFASLNEVGNIITDCVPDCNMVESLEANGVKIICE